MNNQNSVNHYHELSAQLQECKTERELLKIAEYVSRNSKKLKLDSYEVDKLEQIGIRKYEEFQRRGQEMMRNSKIGSKK